MEHHKLLVYMYHITSTTWSPLILFSLYALLAHLFKRWQPGRDQVQVLQTQPVSVICTLTYKLHGNFCLALTHGNLQRIRNIGDFTACVCLSSKTVRNYTNDAKDHRILPSKLSTIFHAVMKFLLDKQK